jgi:dTDP-4-amino-4,6-dideoxygalactose transaminase
MNVPFLDLKAQYSTIKADIDKEISKVILSNAYASGPFVESFEEDFANFCGSKYCIAVSSGTSALHLALLSHGVSPGDEVITVPNSFIATSWAITYCGAKPIFVDVDSSNWLIDVDLIEEKITPRTKAILPVHLYGHPTNINAINKIAKKYNLEVIEDAAQAHASQYYKKRVGGMGNTACFSFYPGKNLGAFGEGGAVVTDSFEVATIIRKLRDHGQTKKYHHDMVGFNYRMDGIQGAVLGVKLKHLQQWTDARNEIAEIYNSRLSHIKNIQIPTTKKNVVSSYHIYAIHLDERDRLMEYMQENNISVGLHYPVPIHLQEAYRDLNHQLGDFPNAEKNANCCLSLPMFPELRSKDQNKVIQTIENFFT